MTSGQPPKIAAWILHQFCESRLDLSGDLLEEFRRRGSVSWYWRQVLAAVGVSLWRELRLHRSLTARAAVSGVALLSTLHLVSGRNNAAWKHLLVMNRPFAFHAYSFQALMLGEIFGLFAASGFVAGRLNQRFRRSLVVLLGLSWTLWFWWSTSSYWLMLAGDSWGQPNFRPYLGEFLLRYFVAITGLWLGGHYSGQPRDLCTAEA